MESRLEEIFSMGISCMSLAVWLVEDRKCSAAVVGLDLACVAGVEGEGKGKTTARVSERDA